jgi:hypothetical protein
MEKRINRKTEGYVSAFKNGINEKLIQLGIKSDDLLQFVYDYERLTFTKEDFVKRKRVKNIVPNFERCCSLRANGEQCTRRKKITFEYCGTHVKGSPHGIIDESTVIVPSLSQSVDVWAQDIKGIMYYIDGKNNVYQAEDIIINKINPKIISKYVKIGETYSIPEFNI